MKSVQCCLEEKKMIILGNIWRNKILHPPSIFFKSNMCAVGNKDLQLTTSCIKIYTPSRCAFRESTILQQRARVERKSLRLSVAAQLLLFPYLKLSQNEWRKLLFNFPCICLLPPNQCPSSYWRSGACMFSLESGCSKIYSVI